MSSGGFDESAFANSQLFDDLYEKYKKDKNSVDPSWRKIFDEFETQDQLGILLSPRLEAPGYITSRVEPARPKGVVHQEQSDLKIFTLIEAYRTYGHLMAKINPVNPHDIEVPYQLRLDNLGFTKEDLSKSFPTCGIMKEAQAPLLDIINTLKEIYCDKIGVEYMGVESPEMESWLQQQIEPNRFRVQLTIEQKQMILQHLNKSELFESFLHTKYVGQKRFSLEGGETLIPILSAIIETGSGLGMDEFVIGMAHRGRLNVLSNILNKSYVDVFSEFDEGYIPDSFEGSGDVKYHKGFSSEISTTARKKVSISLAPNPSHLEAVNSVVEGQTKARQVMTNDEAQTRVIPILVHGDAALSGQGSVYEALQLFKLKGYSTGGTIHIVINNQIGFTTVPEDGRSTYYCTDIAKAFGAPVFHVNAEDPEGCVYATNLAVQLRQKFHCDVFIDMYCYRKYGHNETDEPAFTQPLEYQIIRAKKPIREIYRDELIHQGVLEKFMAEALEAEFKKALQQALRVTKLPPQEAPAKEVIPGTAQPQEDIFKKVNTSVPLNEIREISKKLFTIPAGFNLHPKLQNLIRDRLAMVNGDPAEKTIDWGMGELLAYATLLWKGISVRLSGQDVARGTFSHRHAMWMDQIAERSYFPLSHLKQGQGRCDIVNSPLSEMAVLGFEYGYSISNPDALVLWEAQFGDFSNGAQVIIDQFIATAEQKWGRKSGLTLLLPHGYEGQGPEHSSARIERFLQLSGHDNMLVTYPTTPAQLFHLLRKQVLQPFRKPLIVFTPKGLLRHPECVSSTDDLTKGTFQTILDDPNPPKKAKKIYICSGRIYYDLASEKSKSKIEDMAIIRIEQLYPLDKARLKEIIDQYISTADEIVWVQDEPENMGAWEYIRPQLKDLLPKEKQAIRYVGRERSAATAVGSYALHKKQHAAIMQAVFQNHKPSIFEIARNFKA